MSLLKKWHDLAQSANSEEEDVKFWEVYFQKEQKVYEQILKNPGQVIQGKYSDLAVKFDMDDVTFAGFLDGINTSLVTALDNESLTEDSVLTLEIDLEKLYYNMHYAQADWLYGLPEWDSILTVERRKEIKKEYNETRIVRKDPKVSRNDPCPCGSGKKYKKCCIDK
ncbi:MAG: SEC-C domain-containing protein [Vallitaleaceae bacterium]|nr:SEC-C domain-containing protein [Vallitaleaceae bacterium]